jgi:hypothetical protein
MLGPIKYNGTKVVMFEVRFPDDVDEETADKLIGDALMPNLTPEDCELSKWNIDPMPLPLHVYATNYNLCRITSGMSGMVHEMSDICPHMW